jgi:hypothetical protein
VIELTFGWWFAFQLQVLVHHTIVTLAFVLRIFQIIMALSCPPRKIQRRAGLWLELNIQAKDDQNMKVQ